MSKMQEVQTMGRSSASFNSPSSKSVLRAVAALSAMGSQARMEAPEEAMNNLTREAEKLHATVLAASMNQISASRQMERRSSQLAMEMNTVLKKKLEILGVYRHQATAAHSSLKRWLRHLGHAGMGDVLAELEEQRVASTLRDMDVTLLQLRSDLERYLDAAEVQIRRQQEATSLLRSYSSECRAGFSSLQKGYTASAKAEQQAHRVLRDVWARAVPLLNELASKIADGNVMYVLLRSDASLLNVGAAIGDCKEAGALTAKDKIEQALNKTLQEGLFGQTSRQLLVTIQEIAMLRDRYEAARLGRPPHMAMAKEASKRIGTEHEMALSGVSLVAQEFLSQWQRNNCIVGVAEGVEEMSDIAMKRKETQKKYEKIVSHESKADAVELASNIQELLELVTDLKKNMVTKDELQDTAR